MWLAKHYAVHSGPNHSRHEFNAETSDIDLYETYLPAFRSLVKDGHVYSVMGAYNRFRGESASASPFLFDILRNKWGFDGYIVSDCGRCCRYLDIIKSQMMPLVHLPLL